MKLDWTTTDFAVLYVLLFRHTAIDKHRKVLAAVGTHDGAFFQGMKHELAST
jgi:hypothetical protein